MSFQMFKLPRKMNPVGLTKTTGELSGCSGYIHNYEVTKKCDMPKKPSHDSWGIAQYDRSMETKTFVNHCHDVVKNAVGRLYIYTGSIALAHLTNPAVGLSKYKIMIGDELVAIAMISKDQDVEVRDPEWQLPACSLRPNTTSGFKHLEDTRLLSACSDYWSMRPKRKTIGKRVAASSMTLNKWNNNQLIPKLTYTGILTPTMRSAPLRHTTWSPEMPEITGVPWWELHRRQGQLPMKPEVLITRVIRDVKESLVNVRASVALVAGNLKPLGMVDSSRIVTAFSERSGWALPSEKKCPYTLEGGSRTYYKLLPVIYRSPQHSGHPCGGMLFSDKPITFIKVAGK